MNDYSHALVKEIAAQHLGYNPSPMWGKLVNPLTKDKMKGKPEQYKSIMMSREPHHVRQNSATAHVVGVAKSYINKIPENSHVKANGFTGL